MKRACLILAFILSLVIKANCQYTLEISVSGDPIGCNGRLNSNNITLRINGTPVSMSSNVYRVNLPSPTYSATVEASGSYTCNCNKPNDPGFLIPGCSTSGGATTSKLIDFSTGLSGSNYCRSDGFNIQNARYDLRVGAVFFKNQLDAPTATLSQVCGNNTITLTSNVSNPDFWQVSNNPAGQWYGLGTSAGNSFIATEAKVIASGVPNVYGNNLYFRYAHVACAFRYSDLAFNGGQTSFVFYIPPPQTASISYAEPSCNGKDDGKITISNITRHPLVDGVQITIYKDGDLFNAYNADINQTIVIDKNLVPSIPITAGTWQVRIQNFKSTSPDLITQYGGCPKDFPSSTINDPPPFTLSLNGSTLSASCNLLDNGPHNDGKIPLILSSGFPPFSFSYSLDNSTFLSSTNDNSNSSTPTLLGFTKGTYFVKGAYLSGGVMCESNTISNIVINESPRLNITSLITDNLCLGKNRGVINTTVSGGNGGYNFNWAATGSHAPYTIPPVEDPANLFAGDYSLTVTDSKGCSNITPLSVSIGEPALPVILNATVPSRLLYGGFDMSCALNDGIIELDLENETAPVNTYSWTKDGSPFTPSAFSYAENLLPGVYGITIIDNKNCDASTSIMLNAHPGITAITKSTSDFNGFNTKCVDTNEGEGFVESVTNSFGSLSYTWFDGSTDQFIYDLLPGNYAVNVIDGNGCRDDATLVITPPPAIQPNIQITSDYNGESISCPGADDGAMESFPINGFGPYSYLWDHGPTTKTISGLIQNVYSVTVTDTYGCSTKNSLLISDPATMQLNLAKRSYNGSDLSCRDDSDGEIQLQVVNGVAPYTYVWSEGSTSQNITALIARDYAVTVTDQNGCLQTNQATIINPALLAIDMQHVNNFNGFDITCNGLTNGATRAFIVGGTAPYSFLWSGGEVTETISGLAAGDYTVQAQDANNCPINGAITLVDPPMLLVNANIDNPVSCFGGADGQISLQGIGGAGTHLFSLGGTVYQPSNIFMGLNIGDKDLFVKDGNGCVSPTQKTMTQPDAIAISFQNIIDARCNDPVGSAQAVVIGGNGGYSYGWYDDLTNQPMNTGDILVNAIASIYRVEVLDGKNCPASGLVAVSSIGGASFDVVNVTGVTCFGYSNGSAEINVTSGITPYSYLWSDTQTQPIASNLKAGNYFATVIDGLGCKTIKPLNIISPAALSANYTKTLPNCVGDCDGVISAIALGGTQPYQYNWTNLSSNVPLVTGLCKGDYNLKITDSNSCLFEELVNLPDPEKLNIAGNFTRPICLGRCDGSIEAVGQGGTGPYQFQWQDGPDVPLYSSLCPGDYNVAMTDAHGCNTSNILTLLNGDALPINLGGEATLCVGQSKVLDAGSNWASVNWTSTIDFRSSSPIISITNPGSYFLEAVDAIGCIGLDTFKLETSLDLLKAEFIMPSEVIIGDTLVAIDISWPLPDKVEWDSPPSFTVLPSENSDFLFAIIQEAGTFKIGMRSFLAECRDFREKDLMVLNAAKENSSGRLGFKDDLVQQFSVYPNPNDGRFDVNVLLNEEKEVELMVINFPTGSVEAHYSGASMDLHQIPFDLSNLSQGLYFILLRVGGEQHSIRFVKK